MAERAEQIQYTVLMWPRLVLAPVAENDNDIDVSLSGPDTYGTRETGEPALGIAGSQALTT